MHSVSAAQTVGLIQSEARTLMVLTRSLSCRIFSRRIFCVSRISAEIIDFAVPYTWNRGADAVTENYWPANFCSNLNHLKLLFEDNECCVIFCIDFDEINALYTINEVTLRRAELVLGWVTACGQVNHLSRPMKSAA